MSNLAAVPSMSSAKTEQIRIVVNGQERTAPAGLNVAALLDYLGIEADRVAVELDRAIVRKQAWAVTQVPDGANLEIVQFVGGG